ncbi:hypothetical protein LB507_011285 [Fusarium sp. FIESC RH6]|nr:hypothetical protein LB507_011285 [Fusarium sp. FIESC RH6]
MPHDSGIDLICILGTDASENPENMPHNEFILEPGIKWDGPVISIHGMRGILSRFFLYTTSFSNSPIVIGIGQDVLGRASSYLSVITEWFRECHENHPDCLPSTDVALPTRVLDIGSGCGDLVRLIEVTSGQTGLYTALSHCWGGGIDIRTTTGNYTTQQQGLRYCDLPLSFRDAITVTRGLGLRYLWIDALCIIQDCQTDWEVESGNMAAIYQNAYLVIGADMSSNSDGGFLDVQSGGYHGHGWPIATVDNNIIYARSENRRNNNFKELHPLDLEPLSKRAWTLQEQVLSSRMVHFASKEMVWECKSAIRCECMQLDRMTRFLEPPISLRTLTSCSDTVFRKWYRLVDEVVERSLTKSQDLLPCLSGIARHYQNRGAGTYLAGLWSEDLLVGLTWSSDVPPDRCSRAVPYRGPSWSWISLDKVKNPYGTPGSFEKSGDRFKKVYTKVIEATCVPAGKDPLGAVSDGRLNVVGPLLKMKEDINIKTHYDSDEFQDESLFYLFIGEFHHGIWREDITISFRLNASFERGPVMNESSQLGRN